MRLRLGLTDSWQPWQACEHAMRVKALVRGEAERMEEAGPLGRLLAERASELREGPYGERGEVRRQRRGSYVPARTA